MYAVFFEVRPHPGHLPRYFEHVARLKPVLAEHRGLAFLDRYTLLSDTEVLLSHQLWESEAAISGWRRDAVHRQSQSAGRSIHFADYRIRVAERVLQWQAGGADVTAEGRTTAEGQHVVAVYGTQAVTVAGFAAFESVNHPGRFIALASGQGGSEAEALLRAVAGQAGVEDAAVFRVCRDYGLHERAQAPG